MLTDRSVEGAEGGSSGEAMCRQEAVEGISRPIKTQGAIDEPEERDLIHHEARVLTDGLRELRVTNLQASHLREKLHLQKGNGRHPPGTIALEPFECIEPGGPEYHPEEEVRVQKDFQSDAFSETSPSSPDHSHPHSSALSTPGARRMLE